MDRYTKTWARIWAGWLLVVALSFALLEGLALAKKREGDTLSENTRVWLRTDRGWKSAGPLAFIVALVAFVVWFIPHIVWRLW
ncbi:hypothetical protein M2302_002245 [Micromonospora sp. A200]|uniref:hypothetical protein n=1 Tax=Micromonospora sp. A200 TaxID=2940568 RepID=UPI0024739E86|nr:hypothetical protein [Micromonospora sp. A200]MDH6462070.1 hypothetical protein [Micromonospora sp. A200]